MAPLYTARSTSLTPANLDAIRASIAAGKTKGELVNGNPGLEAKALTLV